MKSMLAISKRLNMTILAALCLALQLAYAFAPRSNRAIGIRSFVDLRSTYDFVIVGGGASGLTVADRLTEDPSTTVLVLEYGPFDSHEPSVLVPGLLNLTSTPYWFNLTSIPQPHLKNRTIQVTIAAAVGGGTVINGMLFNRGAKADYDAWEMLGAEGWGWSDLLPYFKKTETFMPPNDAYAREWVIQHEDGVHGNQGPLQISYPPYQFPVIKNFFNAFHELGITTPKDPNDGSARGVFWAPSTLDPVQRTRSYARTAHYDRVEVARQNYHILPMTAVTKILFDENKKAIGVEYVDRATKETSQISASEEVILAAGAVHTPQILQLSGVGDKDELRRHDIPCIADVPGVGHNFQDHPTLFFINEFKNDTNPNANDLTTNQTFITEQLDLYQSSREGAYTLVRNGGNTVGFVPLPQLASPVIVGQLLQQTSAPVENKLPPSVRDFYIRQRTIQLRQFAKNDTAVQETAFNGGFLPLTLLHPLSRGRISLNSTTPLDAPLVDYGALSHEFDSELFVQILRFNRRLLQAPSLATLQPVELVPGANVTTDQELRDGLPGLVGPTYQHPCCTAPMGKKDDGGVVDPSTLLVWGVHGLSVVDASLMPIIVGAHLMGTVYGVAEKAADMIKERHRIPY
ncbi:choline dehydrogenase-like protein [Phaeosphaeria sp. MPI-PUGE-AT-0046c]|nr:choline dehydrogenase-like protein [Phaeosphaeria sp. MPI-PUGE-AT-0046c]